MADNLDPTSTAAEDCPSQDDGGVVNPDDAVLAVPADGAGQHRALNVGAKPDQIAAWNKQHGYDRPLVTQFLSYLGNLAHLNFGYSYKQGQSVAALFLPNYDIIYATSKRVGGDPNSYLALTQFGFWPQFWWVNKK